VYKTKLCLGTSSQYEISIKEQIALFKQVGFDAFFTNWDKETKNYRKLADEIGMIYQSVHAPFVNSAKMWKDDAEAEIAVNELLECVRDCAEANVPIMVAHTYIGFEPSAGPNEAGIENFGRVIQEAEKMNVKIAFENTEGEEYLETLMKAFSKCENVGFCWDTGHELCYNRGKDMLSLYGGRLIATHINDNLGVSDFDGKIFWTDDLHLLPFDGITSWENVVERLNRHNYNDILTFELNKVSKPNRHENDKYTKMTIEEYITQCYVRACKVAYMKNGI
jgi:sugar phosphate isomerase/epimerase